MLDALRDFVAVATLGSFSKAARAQDVAVSSMTRRIDALEADLGAKLFNRSTRVLSLTEAGEEFLPRARYIASEAEDAWHAVAALHAEPRGTLRVTAPVAFCRAHIAPAMGTFLLKYPLLNVELLASDDMLDLTSARLDMAIRIGVLPDSDLQAIRLAPQCRIACASPAYLARRGTPRTPLDLLRHNCLTTHTLPAPSGWWRFEGVNGNRPLAVNGSFKSNDSNSLMQAALAGVGILHVASWLLSPEIIAGNLVPLFCDHPSMFMPEDAAIHAVRLSGRAQAAKTTLFTEHLREVIGEPPYWDEALRRSLR